MKRAAVLHFCGLMLALGGCTEIVSNPEKSTIELLGEAPTGPTKIGIALAGGGTKAGAYSLGVLAGAATSDITLARINAISSVSGGGYASLFLFSKLMLRNTERARRIDRQLDVSKFFTDCIPRFYIDVLPNNLIDPRSEKLENVAEGDHPGPSVPNPILCPHIRGAEDTKKLQPFRFQQFVRCRHDIFENECDQVEYADRTSTSVNTAILVAETGLAIPPTFVTRSVFDWPVNISPTRSAYQRGIGTAYGLYPLKLDFMTSRRRIREICSEEYFLNCAKVVFSAEPSRDVAEYNLSFQNLRTAIETSRSAAREPDDKQASIPTWIINATASRSRSVFGWTQAGQRNFSRYTLQMSPFGARAGHYGDLSSVVEKFDLLEAVSVSAAFLDPNQTAYQPPYRLPIAILLHLSALDWGIDIPNPNVDRSTQIAHNFMPFPTYFAGELLRSHLLPNNPEAHSAYIRLMDGGNNDNTGAFSLIEAGMNHIVIADNAEDQFARLQNLCLLRNEIAKRPAYGQKPSKLKLVFPGFADFDNHCRGVDAESDPEDTYLERGILINRPITDELAISTILPSMAKALSVGSNKSDGYNVYEWKHPVVLGCVKIIDAQVDRENISENCDGTLEPSEATSTSKLAARIYVVKPAINYEDFRDNYTEKVDGKIRVKKDYCSKDFPGLCEVAAYVSKKFPSGPPAAGDDQFPQNPTIGMTLATDAMTFGAYRELGRWHMSQVWQFIDMSDVDFSKAANSQGGDQAVKIHRVDGAVR